MGARSFTTPEDADALGRAGVPHWLLRWPPARRLLRIQLFQKLLIANAGIVVLMGLGAVLITGRVVTVAGLDPVAAIEVLGFAFLTVSVAANALLIRVALSPLAALEETALRVQQGDRSVRAPTSALADDDLARVIELFNQVLDWSEAERVRRTELSLRVLQAEERERERLGRALYGGTAQTLAGVLVRMRVVERIKDVAQGVALLEEVRDEVARALEETRRMARRLHPPELKELGVGAALEAHARHLTEERPMRVSFDGRVPEERLSPDARLVLFRVVQEAISNAVLHSEGSVVRVRFEAAADGLVTEVVDDGRGFNPDRLLFSGVGGLGLLGMRERAEYVSAAFELESAPGAGARVRLVIPWSTQEPDGQAAPAPAPTRVRPAARAEAAERSAVPWDRKVVL